MGSRGDVSFSPSPCQLPCRISRDPGFERPGAPGRFLPRLSAAPGIRAERNEKQQMNEQKPSPVPAEGEGMAAGARPFPRCVRLSCCATSQDPALLPSQSGRRRHLSYAMLARRTEASVFKKNLIEIPKGKKRTISIPFPTKDRKRQLPRTGGSRPPRPVRRLGDCSLHWMTPD